MNTYSKGAEWRKWDLHLHTPSSYDYKNKSVSDEIIIETLHTNGVSLAAITDHHEMNIIRIQNLQNLGKKKGITILPGIEFLSDARGKKPIHMIGIFSESCNLEHIWGQVKNRTEIRKILGEGKRCNEVYCDLMDTIHLIHELGGLVSIHAGEKHASIDNITNSLEHAVAQKKDIAEAIDIFELGKPEDQSNYIKHVLPSIKQRIPMIICSDNHDITNYKVKENCWIKADPTFEGLKQVINEPEHRVFIGDTPEILTRIKNNRTRYISELQINSMAGYDGSYGKWFNSVKLPLNSELVAIIGNKGSGKSAIADILALCSNYQNEDDFSFLKSKKFKNQNGKLAKNFEAQITWESELKNSRNLDEIPDISEQKLVKYLSQGQFERLTNEINTVKEFQKEIEKVVFSHIDDTEKLGSTSFQELVNTKTNIIDDKISSLQGEVRLLNEQIIKFESKKTKKYRAEVENKLKLKHEEVEALKDPAVVTDPNDDPEKKKLNEGVLSQISKMNEELQKLENDKQQYENAKKQVLIDLKRLSDYKSELTLKSEEINSYINLERSSFNELNLNIEEIIVFKTNFTKLDEAILEKKTQKDSIIKALEGSETDASSHLYKKIDNKKIELKVEHGKLDNEQKKYQNYLIAQNEVNEKRSKIIGEKNLPETLEYLKCEIEYLDNTLEQELKDLNSVRKSTVKKIYQNKQKVIHVYKDAQESLNKLIEENSELLENYTFKIDASLVKSPKFESNFLSHIHRNKSGSFYSKEGGEKLLINMSSEINFNDEGGVIDFLDKIVTALEKDIREGQNHALRILQEQVKDIQALYDFLFELNFLDFNYQLKQGEKQIEQLSPGERGALLLVFYLLLDKSDIPLVIDQPEDNLDNHSVATVLVPFIREAKKKRQIIIVTHNPNLAIVSDAEQVIYVNIDKEDSNLFSTESGSIENKDINKKIVNVLEGTMPAFNMRKSKYHERRE